MNESAFALMREGLALKESIEKERARLAEIANALRTLAEFRDGSATGHVYAGDLHAKVVLKSNVRWDQAGLEQARAAMGDEKFFKVFKWKYEPRNARALQGFFDYGGRDDISLVRAACTETPGQPSVTYEYVGATEAADA